MASIRLITTVMGITATIAGTIHTIETIISIGTVATGIEVKKKGAVRLCKSQLD